MIHSHEFIMKYGFEKDSANADRNNAGFYNLYDGGKKAPFFQSYMMMEKSAFFS